jgi:hypothetical protein
MLNRLLVLAIGLVAAALVFPVGTFAQNHPKIESADGWVAPFWEYPRITDLRIPIVREKGNNNG